ncbi:MULTISPECIES: ankyrin repeat domain-containing protein [unclassified Treponema]|uniref:ankyrin repeat domain-containing protein n=1 Tax=unclassified Treponema TaxID=2638727 RepID=UPI0020A569C0|nr:MULTISPECIES: ankyrin repeat domain-containing protein [unclassified Treponema]UTC68448.1 ankyrin repeat domain-containing protein [Treponema sp. OMZ 789]UTC71157.1 ankyrin repeat domain-containing protein [Treponema sp. OMZ 790]UTC73868.1 ankyrin repeat domain-containing protein [Treponema sp. OMZ 791]
MHIDEFIKAAKKNNAELIKAYLQNGFDINTQDKDGFTAVMEAAEFGYKDLFWFLIEKGADVLIKADYNFSIIHAVGLGGDKKMLDYVISKGVYIDEKITGGEQDGMTIKDYALLAKNEELNNYLKSL